MSYRAPHIRHIHLAEEIGSGAHATVYRGSRGELPVAVKVLREGGGGTGQVDAALRFRQEASALARLDHRGVVKILEVGDADGRPYLVMEHIEGQDLAMALQAGPMEEARLVDIAEQLALALTEVHRHGLVHQDIKPSNVILQRSGQVKLIDFGLAQAGMDRRDHEVAGTLLYAAPEQIRATQGGVDARADLYALGGTLFHCATGRPPFEGEDVGKLIQLHAVGEVPSASDLNPDISVVFSAILTKLLAKDPADRYQSAAGLLADLQQWTALTTAAQAGTLVLGSRDFLRLGTEVRLVGRARELEALDQCRRWLADGHGASVIIEGPSGTGKTRLARELVDGLRGPATLVLSAKCNAGETTPFGSLRDALDRHITQLLWRDDDGAQGRRALRRAAGDWGGLLKRLSPGMRRILADVPDVAALDPRNEQVRFYDALAEFIVALASDQMRVVLLVDDVQWLDRSSPEVLARLAGLARSAPVLVVMTARNQGRDGEAVEALARRLGANLDRRIQLQPLSEADSTELVSHHLGNRPIEAGMVSKIVGLSQGNPFAIGQYVRTLVESGALALGPDGWFADERIGAVNLPRDVVKLVVDRIETLPAPVVRFARVGALLGSAFRVGLAAEVADCSTEEALAIVDELVRANLVEWIGDGSVGFIHDRIREAMDAPLSDSDRRALHQAIAQVLEVRDDGSAQHAFALARHYARGHADDNPVRVFETGMAAGKRALDSYAYPEAFDWLQGALSLGEGLDIDRRTMVDLRESLGVAATRIGRLQLALDHLESAISEADRPIDRARLCLHIASALAGGEPFRAGLGEDPAGPVGVRRALPGGRSVRRGAAGPIHGLDRGTRGQREGLRNGVRSGGGGEEEAAVPAVRHGVHGGVDDAGGSARPGCPCSSSSGGSRPTTWGPVGRRPARRPGTGCSWG